MQIAREPGSLTDTLLHAHVKFASDLMEPVTIHPPQQCQKCSRAQRLEPGGLIIRWLNGEIEERPGFVPHAAVIARHHAETVVAWRKIGIERLPVIAGVFP